MLDGFSTYDTYVPFRTNLVEGDLIPDICY